MKNIQVFLVIILFFVSFFTFIPAINSGFAELDDNIMIRKNYPVSHLNKKSISLLFTKRYHGLYHPLVTLSYAIEYKIFKLTPEIFHFDNILLHFFNTILVLIIFIMLTKSFYVSYIIAFLFAIHPQHVEVVAWISARKDLLYSFFYLLSIYFYLKTYTRKRNRTYICISLIFFLFSCFSKVTAITLPMVLILFDYFSNKISKERFKYYLFFFAIAAIFTFIGIYTHYISETMLAFSSFDVIIRFLNTHSYIFFYIFKFLLPINLSALYIDLYDFNIMPPFYIFLSATALYILILFIFYSTKYTKKFFLGFVFFFITLLPSSGILPTGISEAADRYMYIPLIGLSYLFAELFAYIYNKYKNKYFKATLIAILIIIFLVLITLSFKRTIDWKNNNYVSPKAEKFIQQKRESFTYKQIKILKNNGSEQDEQIKYQGLL